jgi:hypothetical protein
MTKDNPIILEIGTGMYARITTMLAELVRSKGKTPVLVAIESGESAQGLAADRAKETLTALGGHLVRGHSTEKVVVAKVKEHMQGRKPDVAVSETIGEIFSMEGYPHTYYEAVKSGMIGEGTTSIPAEGATLWRPADSRMTEVRKGSEIRMGEKIMYTEPDGWESFLAPEWGLWEYYNLGAGEDEAKKQLHQTITSQVEIHVEGYMDSIVLAMWTKLGNIEGTYHDPLIDECPDMHRKTGRTGRAAIVHSAYGYDGYSSKWKTPRIPLEPGQNVRPGDRVKMTTESEIGFIGLRYKLKITITRKGQQIREWEINLQHMDVCPPYQEAEIADNKVDEELMEEPQENTLMKEEWEKGPR